MLASYHIRDLFRVLSYVGGVGKSMFRIQNQLLSERIFSKYFMIKKDKYDFPGGYVCLL